MSGTLIRSRFVLALTLATVASILAIGCAQTAVPAAPTAAAPASGAATSAPAAAQPAGGAAPAEIKIGLIYPLTGSAAGAGVDSKNGPELAIEIVNGSYNLPMPLGKGGGLPNLGGAKVKLVIVDSQGVPEKGQSEAERLITQEKVVALVGLLPQLGYPDRQPGRRAAGHPLRQRRVLLAVPDRPGASRPSSAPVPTTSPTAKVSSTWSTTSKAKGAKISTIATINENTLAGTDASTHQQEHWARSGATRWWSRSPTRATPPR